MIQGACRLVVGLTDIAVEEPVFSWAEARTNNVRFFILTVAAQDSCLENFSVFPISVQLKQDNIIEINGNL